MKWQEKIDNKDMWQESETSELKNYFEYSIQ